MKPKIKKYNDLTNRQEGLPGTYYRASTYIGKSKTFQSC